MKDYEIDYKKLYEEEHKKYKGALERARGHHSVALHYSNADEIQELEHIFPELKEKENDDERIRKDLIGYFEVCGNMTFAHHRVSDILAWLEKQGELSKYNPHKETVESISIMVDKYSRADSDLQDFYENVKVKCKDAIEYYNTFIEKQDEQKPADKIIERAGTEKQRVLLTETNGNAHIDWDCRSLQDVKLLLKRGLEYIDAQLEKQDEQKPADLDVEEKELRDINPTWSEVDETRLRAAQTFINNTSLIGVDGVKEATIDWLKSLKERIKNK